LNTLPEEKPRWIQIARILRARGNKGEVAGELLTDFPARLATIGEVYLAQNGQEPKAIRLQKFWLDQNHPGHCVFHFEGSSTISEAEKFRGLDVLLPFEARVQLPAGQYFVTDLMGCIVFELPTTHATVSSPPCALETAPAVLGRVRDVFFPGEGLAGTPLLQVDAPEGELLIPLAEDICKRIDVVARRIEVNLPEGLRTQNVAD
jgi:16S rRNA processing protein RimM